MKPVESHDGPEEEVGEVEVVFQQVSKGVAAFLAVTVLQCKAHAAHDAETTAAVEQDVLQVERTRDQRFLQEGVCTLHATHLSLKNHFFSFLLRLIVPRTCQELYGSSLMEASVTRPDAKHIHLLLNLPTL